MQSQVFEEYKITPEQFIDLKGLMGDKSNNIPGIPGVGEKTAIKLLEQFENIENLIQNTEKITGAKLREKVESNKEQAVLSKRLATIVTNVPIDIDLGRLKRREANYDKLMELFRRYEFNSLIPRIEKGTGQTDSIDKNTDAIESSPKENIYEITDMDGLERMINEVREYGTITLKTITEEKNIITDDIIHLAAIAKGDIQYYINFKNFNDKQELLNVLGGILKDGGIKKIGHNLKKEIIHFYRYNIDISNLHFDTMIGEYLIDPAKSNYDLKDLVSQYLGKEIINEQELISKRKGQISLWEASDETKKSICNHVRIINKIYHPIKENLKKLDLEELYYDVELPLVEVLAFMEFQGIKADKNILLDLEIEFKEKIEQLTKEIYNLSGVEFNINSPKQLGEVLFEKLGLPPVKKTKTGYSTDAEVLEKLYDKHYIIPKISEYRQITKLKSTYVDGLLGIINPVTNRIHSNFNQTTVITGRISSAEPNLQNIPTRVEMGRRLRKVFVCDNGNMFIDADYSQIELRVLAHIANDANLIDAFMKDQDIHKRTASEILGVPMDEVTPGMRNSAKAVNFGIVYGISDFGLSRNLDIPVHKAKQYIDSYFEKYPSIKQYMKNTVKEAEDRGYVSTILHRRRYLPELRSSNSNVRNFGERMAMNTPIQGSAADIIKIAMVKIYKTLKEGNFKAKLLLQVHDELLIECPENEMEAVTKILRESMENAVKMSVPLKVDISYANNWYDIN
jgi:DNA polymerase-1